MVASTKGPLIVVKVLLRCPKMDVTLQNVDGKTALDLAHERNRGQVVVAFGNRAALTTQDGATCN